MEKRIIDLNIFAHRLSECFRKSSETTYSLAEKLSLTAATVSRYLNAKMSPKITTVYEMARILSVNPMWLMGYDVRMDSPASAHGDKAENNIIKIAGRDGSFVERKLSDEQLELLRHIIDQMPDANDL